MESPWPQSTIQRPKAAILALSCTMLWNGSGMRPWSVSTPMAPFAAGRPIARACVVPASYSVSVTLPLGSEPVLCAPRRPSYCGSGATKNSKLFPNGCVNQTSLSERSGETTQPVRPTIGSSEPSRS